MKGMRYSLTFAKIVGGGTPSTHPQTLKFGKRAEAF